MTEDEIGEEIEDIANQLGALSTRHITSVDDFSSLAPLFGLKTKTIGFIVHIQRRVADVSAVIARIESDPLVSACKHGKSSHVKSGATDKIRKAVSRPPMRNAIQTWLTIHGQKMYSQFWLNSRCSIQVSGCRSTAHVRSMVCWIESILKMSITHVKFTIFSSEFDLGRNVCTKKAKEKLDEIQDKPLLLCNELAWDGTWVDCSQQPGVHVRVTHPNGTYKLGLHRTGKGTLQCTNGNHAWAILSGIQDVLRTIS